MNIKENNLHKIIAAAALGLILIFLIVIATSGKNLNNDNNSGEFDETIDNTDKLSGDTDRNTDGTADTITNNENESTGSTENDTKQEQPPKFTSALTGLECSEEVYSLIPFAFVTDPDEPLYGISYSEITVEIPLENGKTRLLIYISDEHNLGKIGTILPTRSYITGITELIPGVIVAYGDDGIKDHTSKSESVSIDLKENFGYAYMENGKCVYTDTQTILAFAKLEDIDKTNHQTVAAPFEFCNFGDFIVGKNEANKIEIPYSSSAPTSLIYESESKEYVLSKSCKTKNDLLTGEMASYTNVFILFSNCITYESAYGVQAVTDISGGGYGYYASGGGLTEIRWRIDDNKNLVFESLNGERLVVNRGNSYIGYYKSSDKSSVTFE